ncbi:FecCD family ABC transporter permease [Mobilicoccus caccae]|uniref:ABC transporter permease n=1 Tax=Mobilicoccus caccae TaxID=1859295 RepID=A0ABQ6IKU4_9MICO|nr:iron chelate uptake ABC transporter family permease subunit [Mobilicoccus caccae]GMA38061.1 ABC transporter permease [Mobilicoccus caccae]
MTTTTPTRRSTDRSATARDAGLVGALWGRRLLALGVCLVASVALAGSILLAVTFGPAPLSTTQVWGVLAQHLGLGADVGVSRLQDAMVWDLRLPRTLLAALCGAGLSVCGAVLQSLLRNPLAEPYLLGVSSGASTGAVAVIVLGVGMGSIGLSGGAFVGALVAFAVMLGLAWAAGGTTDKVILAGIAVTQMFSAITSFVVMVAADAETTRGVLFWLLGSLSTASWTDVTLTAVVLALVLGVTFGSASALDAFAFGERAAAGLGISVTRTRAVLLIATALLTAVVVSSSGAIGFVGLVLPHIARMLVGPRHRRLLPTVALLGAVFLVWVDTLARTLLAPQEIPVGVVTAIVGVPVFTIVLIRRKRS